jgi:hypothetical protein
VLGELCDLILGRIPLHVHVEQDGWGLGAPEAIEDGRGTRLQSFGLTAGVDKAERLLGHLDLQVANV